MSDPRGTRRWRTVSKAWLAQHDEPFCVMCGTEENLSVDHIKPYSKFPELFWEPDNWQVMCMTHNIQKGNKTTEQPTDWINPRWLEFERSKTR